MSRLKSDLEAVTFLVTAFCLFVFNSLAAIAQTTKQAAVNLTARYQDSSTQNIRAWWTPASTPTSATIYTKPASNRTWAFKDSIPAPRDQWETELLSYESEVAVEQFWNVRGLDIFATGYMSSRYDMPPDALSTNRKVLIITDIETRSKLIASFNRLIDDLQREGWVVDFKGASSASTPKELKKLIYASRYDTVRGMLTHVLIVGDLPYAMSGGFSAFGAIHPPDGHTEHGGAWASDAYYADVETSPGINAEYQWTDDLVDMPLSELVARPDNVNIPGDGKFDQSLIPTDLELCVGRVDMRRLQTFGVVGGDRKRELELIGQYLDRNHSYRTREFEPPSRALIDDNFGMFVYVQQGLTITEAFAASGWRSFSPIVGAENVFVGDWISDSLSQTLPSLQTHPSLFAYACGGGQYDASVGVGTVSDFARDSLKASFTLLFGSYFGDVWSDDNFMRSALAADGWVLTCGWSGRPHWFLHTMASGETIGECQRLSANNAGEYIGATQYDPSSMTWAPYTEGFRSINNLLLGDPTLTLQGPVLEGDLSITQSTTSNRIELLWSKSPQHVESDPNAQVAYIVESTSTLSEPFTYLKYIAPADNPIISTEIELPKFHAFVRVRPLFTTVGRLSPLVGRGLIRQWIATSVDESTEAFQLVGLRGITHIYDILGMHIGTINVVDHNPRRFLESLRLNTGLYLLVDEGGNTDTIYLTR
ncbi:MAG: hypothetical protein HYX66_06550 [Ignavibacteria bacterium]|nr:hypothetical protein [Ignavibacteria bacterium]